MTIILPSSLATCHLAEVEKIWACDAVVGEDFSLLLFVKMPNVCTVWTNVNTSYLTNVLSSDTRQGSRHICTLKSCVCRPNCVWLWCLRPPGGRRLGLSAVKGQVNVKATADMKVLVNHRKEVKRQGKKSQRQSVWKEVERFMPPLLSVKVCDQRLIGAPTARWARWREREGNYCPLMCHWRVDNTDTDPWYVPPGTEEGF